ncbi:Flagellar hook-associated protein 2 C-terminal domain-containing protein [Kosakonia sp. BK9b]
MINGLNLSSLSTAARVTPTVTVNTPARAAKSNSASAGSAASAKVIFGSQTSEIAAVYSLSPKKISASVSPQNNPAIQQLMQSAMGSGSVSALGNLGSALLGNLKEDRADFTQALTGLAMNSNGGKASAVTLDIVTQSGSTVHLTMTQQEDGMAVEVKTEGNSLNDDEADAIANLGAAFQKTLNGLGAESPELDITGLTQFDSSVLKSVDLKTDARIGNDSQQSLNFHADSKERWVAYEDRDFSLKMSSDVSHSALSGNYAQQQSALNAYDEKFDKARIAGHGDREQMAALKSVFRALNTTAANDESLKVGVADIRVGDNGKSRLSGLNDFSLTLTQTEESINPSRQDEKERFAYQASQTTEESVANDGSKTVKQTARSHLSAAWHEALDPSIPLALNAMKSSQNYYYHLLENDEESSTTLNYTGRGQLASVGQHEQVNNRHTTKKYVMGEMVDQTVDPEQYTRNNVVSLLRAAAQ